MLRQQQAGTQGTNQVKYNARSFSGLFDLLCDEVGTLDWLVALQQFLLLFFLGPAKNAGYRPQTHSGSHSGQTGRL
ncbi:hypothetical protein BK140_20340 [Paenibacillus macerans]|nr:hypothetical protein BK140_20340 [Paenibacillus macerans]